MNKELFSMMLITFNYNITKDNTWVGFQFCFLAAFLDQFPKVHYVHQGQTWHWGRSCHQRLRLPGLELTYMLLHAIDWEKLYFWVMGIERAAVCIMRLPNIWKPNILD